MGMILAVSLSPRIRLDVLPTESADLRVQDLLLPVCLGYLLLAPRGQSRVRWAWVWGPLVTVFLFLATAVTAGHALINDSSVSDLVRLAYFGRTVEIFVLAAVVAALYLRSGAAGTRIALRSLHLAVAVNATWLIYQLLSGDVGTLFGEVGDSIESYGPKLVGEPSAFGTGAFWAFVAALAVSEHRSALSSNKFCWMLMAAAVAGAFFSQSRVNLATVLLFLILLLASSGIRPRLNLGAVAMVGLAVVPAVMLWGPQIAGRATPEAVAAGLGVRVEGIWEPLARVLSENVLLGVGPGGLTAPDMPRDEAHNVLLRAALDYGVLVGFLLVAALITLALRARRAARGQPEQTVQWAGTFAYLAITATMIAGLVQDALTAVTSTHLMMLAVGLYVGVRSLDGTSVQYEVGSLKLGNHASAKLSEKPQASLS